MLSVWHEKTLTFPKRCEGRHFVKLLKTRACAGQQLFLEKDLILVTDVPPSAFIIDGSIYIKAFVN